MTNSRQKGKRGELELAHFLEDNGFTARRGQQYMGAAESPDVVVEDTPFHWECKRVEKTRMKEWLAKARDEAGYSKVPCVCHRANGEEWTITFNLQDFLNWYALEVGKS